MIDAALLLKDLQGELGRLSADLLAHVQEDPEVRARLEGEWRKAFDAQRTGRTFEDWLDDRLTQVAVAWLLAFVFVRFCEDNGLVDEARIGGVGTRGGEARDAQQRFFAQHPNLSDRDYLHEVLRAAAELRGLDGVVGEGESPLWLIDPPADAITRVLALFRSADESGNLVHDFTDSELSTRFLGDLYQDLSEHAKSTYALLQTPEFVEEFILDRTLDPAIETFGLANTTLIDPTCGSGHFLLGGFRRIFEAWRASEPGVSTREHAERALKAVTGVDLNPFAAAIARFRLLVAALMASGERRLADAPTLEPDVAVGDSLLWGARSGQLAGMEATVGADRQFLYATEHAAQLRRVFDRQYAAVVGNPPYITVKDKALNEQYRARYESCHRQYSLGVPFTERFFELACQPDGLGRPAGFVGMITANSFMKREFGKKLIECFMPSWDLTHIVDTSGAYIPGHGTPTVVLMGRHQLPTRPTVRVVMGIRGEPAQPEVPSRGLVWSAILDQIDSPGSEGTFVSVADAERSVFGVHPWSMGGGGAAELKALLDGRANSQLGSHTRAVGRTSVLGLDDAWILPTTRTVERLGLQEVVKQFVVGDAVRDWRIDSTPWAPYPYDGLGGAVLSELSGSLLKLLWPSRAALQSRTIFGKSLADRGEPWWIHLEHYRDKFSPAKSIAFSNVSTHNHFVLDSGGKLFNSHAPVIKLDLDASEDEYFGLLGVLNSSVAAFWLRQQCHDKGNRGEGGGICSEAWERFYEFDGTKVQSFPIPAGRLPCETAKELDAAARRSAEVVSALLFAHGRPTSVQLTAARDDFESILGRMMSDQEELDWECMHLYGLTETALTSPSGLETPCIRFGERAYEIVLARKMRDGISDSAWFARNRAVPTTELPGHWPAWYKDLVNERIRLIKTDRDVGLIEQPEHKRRWAREPWEKQQERALREWLQDRLEARELWFEGSGDQERAVCRSVAQLTDRVLATDPEFLDVARLWKGGVEIDPVQVVAELVADEHVPAQSGARYKGKGFDKRRQWERTWELQKMEDDGIPLPDGLERIPVPPKYTSAEFAKSSYWRHRGKLDVPKERFTSIWGAESAADGSLVLAWAGFDHVQLTQAIGALLVDRQNTDAWDADRSWPLVVAMAEQLFWLDLWHHEHDPRWGDSPANLFRSMVTEQAHRGGRTLADVADWRAPAATRGRKKKDGA